MLTFDAVEHRCTVPYYCYRRQVEYDVMHGHPASLSDVPVFARNSEDEL
jgi:hypothetical protein